MDYSGKVVFHKAKYGKGIIISNDDKYVYVKFESEAEKKRFSCPDCFESYLTLEDPATAAEIDKEIKRKKAAERASAERSRQIVYEDPSSTPIKTKQTRSRGTASSVNAFPSTESFFLAMRKALYYEIECLKKGEGKRTQLLDGRLVEAKNDRYIYTFESDSELNLPDNTQISLWLSNARKITAIVVNCEEFTVILATKEHIGTEVPVAEFTAEVWMLLEFLNERLLELQDELTPIAKSIILDGPAMKQPGKAIAKGQDTACRMTLSQPITFIWGPPGTGKTETLALIADAHMQKQHRVLMLSYSNVSVDGAVMRVFRKEKRKTPGKIVRYGYPRDKELLQHDYLSSYNLALRNHPELKKEREALIEERKHLRRESKRFVDAGNRLVQIRKALAEEEKAAVRRASFVATTVSKAIADSTIYNGFFDTVIFDEASMAYIPQIVFSAGLARKHFVCIGDFNQLPPIVQSGNESALNEDIFQYCGIVSAVDNNCGHAWLCMLDTQYRMHPEIASFAGRSMYHGLLKSGEGMEKKRKPIQESIPYSGKALQFVDLSGMYSVCVRTADQSRINVLSAIIAMRLALSASYQNSVGVITPYSSQARLLHAMAKDCLDSGLCHNKISCATVHQFQGSEQDVIVYDAVDCYRMTHPGMLLTSTQNNYANRLYNVAVTRAKGKMISIANIDFMKAKNLSRNLIFRKMIDWMESQGGVSKGRDVHLGAPNPFLCEYALSEGERAFLKDVRNASREINIDIPGGTSAATMWLKELADAVSEVKKRGVKVYIRTDDKSRVPTEIKRFVIENKGVINPVGIIDRAVVWYGMPLSNATFYSGEKTIPTLYKPIFRCAGKRFAQALYGFLGMNQTVDKAQQTAASESKDGYDNFANYVAGEIRCTRCGAPMRLKKGSRGRFFLGCSNFPTCDATQMVQPEMVNKYFRYSDRRGKLCPIDHTTLEAKIGKYGLYVCCGALTQHKYSLDQL